MSVLIFIDQAEGHIKKAALEAMSYGAKVAAQLGTTAEGIVLGSVKEDLAALGKYGVKKIHHVNNAALDHFDAQTYTHAIAEAVKASGADVVIFSNNVDGKAIAPRLSAQLKAGLVSGAVALPDTSNGFVVKKTVFSGKAFANIAISTPLKIVALNPNSYKVETADGTAEVAALNVTVETPKVKVTAVNKVTGEIPLSEAEIVVSGGRGLKGPENWGMITDLAHVLGAATACSRPVADAHWRPHHEHVGQTGLAIAPNLYIAVGISGAIQHLAGVNRSKVIVVINKDPEAPFFKAADYGIVGDAFEVMPKIIAAAKKVKGMA
ncbi:electron transfer flavoprotein subunit alpha/FixB family protein [Pseudoflavitalea sp. G-6-1-2]|uniref:electron transfer flavoprotein subunit alpha/FixB family protein n=1 Tax=Pseudoflavitalea sp. G-6-1-2 TaxID=2728841 RepID=UPI00146CD581|nr:electron transfer flavoprotein subunit alpha/FixB family protein [Pseudoflavitalea sp. G-6-1-2]NML22301.1 electron transfer flavoprotein subunit alpha/FixB family protein [Pseudoflavitalea sp. G-6-1-2]